MQMDQQTLVFFMTYGILTMEKYKSVTKRDISFRHGLILRWKWSYIFNGEWARHSNFNFAIKILKVVCKRMKKNVYLRARNRSFWSNYYTRLIRVYTVYTQWSITTVCIIKSNLYNSFSLTWRNNSQKN